MLAGMTTYEAIVDYGKERGWEFLQLLGFTRRRGLCKATYSHIFRRIDVAAFEAAVSRWICGRLKPGDTPHLAIDGKTLRGSRNSATPAVHLLSVYAPDVEAVVAQMRVDAKTNELKASLEMLAILPIKGASSPPTPSRPTSRSAPRDRGGRGLHPAGQGQPTDAAGRYRGRFRRAGGRPFPPPKPAPCRLPGAGHDRGQGAWSDREADAGVDDLAGGLLGRLLAGLPASVPPAARAAYG